jgi:hypothetical protein
MAIGGDSGGASGIRVVRKRYYLRILNAENGFFAKYTKKREDIT